MIKYNKKIKIYILKKVEIYKIIKKKSFLKYLNRKKLIKKRILYKILIFLQY